MTHPFHPSKTHPKGETEINSLNWDPMDLSVDTFSGKVHIEIDEDSRTTPIGTFAFFVDFLKSTGCLDQWIDECPLDYTSPNAPRKRDVLGTALLSVLNGHNRYSHATALRADQVNPEFLLMTKIVSEDSLRRALARIDEDAARSWQQGNLLKTLVPLLEQKWICDIDTTIKPIYGRQEGADISYNPHKPGRPSHTYHTYIMSGTRLILDSEVRPGKEHAPSYTRPELWRFLERLSPSQRPEFIRGDAAFGSEETMCWPENNDFKYLFKLRQHKNVKRLIEELELDADWDPAGKGWEASESSLCLNSWTRRRRVVVLRRETRKKKLPQKGDIFQLLGSSVEIVEEPVYDYIVLVTNLENPKEELGQLYRDRADCENVFDELKNQWGWGGFTTKDIKRCQIMARIVAQIYNWWSIFTHTIDRGRHHEAITTRPLILANVGRLVFSGGSKILKISAKGGRAQVAKFFVVLCAKVRKTMLIAEQLAEGEGWKEVLLQIFKPSKPTLGYG